LAFSGLHPLPGFSWLDFVTRVATNMALISSAG
jgi:hypothetical protein